MSARLAQRALTSVTEIDKSLQRLKDDGISMDKINLGLAYYGYAYILEDDSCTKPGCAAKSMVKQGPCGKTQQGLMDFAAIEQVIGNNSVDQTKDEDAAVMYFTWDKNNWYGFHCRAWTCELTAAGLRTMTTRRWR